MNPTFQRTTFQSSAPDLRDAPPDAGFEVAFAGRSNAGKSSALNAICHQTKLARTSRTPGRTQQLVFFRVDDERRLVDLPGYGFARVSLAVKTNWQRLMGRYLERRECLRGLVVVMDIRHPLTAIDRQMLDWGIHAELPMLLLLAKADKLKRGAIERTLQQVRSDISDIPVPVSVQAFSATKRLGLDAAQRQLEHWLELPSSPARAPSANLGE